MDINWQMIFNFVLFAMIVTAFTFAIWSYIKTNAIKNSNSPSVDSSVNGNNTYVNNIASAPNIVFFPTQAVDGLYGTYIPKKSDNGTEFIIGPVGLGPELEIKFDFNKNFDTLPAGFYFKVSNKIDTPSPYIPKVKIVSNIGNSNTYDVEAILSPGETIFFVKDASVIEKSFTKTGWYGKKWESS